MEHFWTLGLIGGLLALDDRAGWQSLLSQPVFASTAVGYLLGQVGTCLFIGLFLELIWLAILPMRGTRRPDQVGGAITGAACACTVVQGGGDPRFAFIVAMGVLIGLLTGELAARISLPLMILRDRRLSRVVQVSGFIGSQPTTGLIWVQGLSMAYVFVMELILVLLFLLIGANLAVWISNNAGKIIVGAFEQWALILPAFGVASLIHVYWHKHLTRFLLMSAAVILIVLWIK
jgi:mannose/fructose/N-acetylgalactosamine-specific phosphotransferase system component IIC